VFNEPKVSLLCSQVHYFHREKGKYRNLRILLSVRNCCLLDCTNKFSEGSSYSIKTVVKYIYSQVVRNLYPMAVSLVR